MQYRTLSRGNARQVRGHLINGEEFDLNLIGDIVGDGDALDTQDVAQIASEAAREIEAGKDPEYVEQKFSGKLYLTLRDVPVEVRDDTGFWRWLTLGALLPFTRLRDRKLGVESLGVGTNKADILACRMFLRGQVSRSPLSDGTLDFSLATSPGTDSHDFWQSHILRRTTGAEVEFAKALIRRQSDTSTRMPTTELRPFVRDSVNRKKRTLATFLMSGDEADAYLADERAAWQKSLEDEGGIEEDLD